MRIGYLHLKYQIDEIIVLNLPNRIDDRKFAVQGAFDAAGALTNRMTVWEAIPGSNFETIEDLVEAASDDGFDFFRDAHKKGRIHKYPLAVPAQLWSYCQMLRHISEMEESKGFLIVYDDRYIIDFCQFAHLWHTLRLFDEENDQDYPFMILQIGLLFSGKFKCQNAQSIVSENSLYLRGAVGWQ